MKREDLEAREFGLIIASSNFPFYAAPEADAVMDAMEDRIKELVFRNLSRSFPSGLVSRIGCLQATQRNILFITKQPKNMAKVFTL